MQNIFKKSFDIIKDSPFLTLYFVLYLIAIFLIIPTMLLSKNMLISAIIIVLLMLLTCAFLAGWFNMIKTSVISYKKDKTPEEKLNDAIKLKDGFFSGVASYILPVIIGFIVFIGLLYLHSYVSDIIFGKIDDVLYNLSKYANDPAAFKNYFISLPDATWNVIFKKSLFTYIACSFITLAFLYWASSLYLNCKNSINPIAAAFNAIKLMFCKFYETILIFILLMVVNFILMFLQAFFIENVIISFITMILRIYFAAYIVVLIFALYENKVNENKALAIDCNNGPNSIGQNDTCN